MSAYPLFVKFPRGFDPHRLWALKELARRLSAELHAEAHDHDFYRLSCGSDRSLIIPDIFFKHHFNPSLSGECALPPVRWWEAADLASISGGAATRLPVLFGEREIVLGAEIRLTADLVGGLYCELSRYEEYFNGERDEHDRFPSERARAFANGYLDIPVIDEYAELVRRALRLRSTGDARVHISCDVDHPFEQAAYSLKWLLRSRARQAMERVRGKTTRKTQASVKSRASGGAPNEDPCAAALRYQMHQLSARGMSGTFHFIPSISDSKREGPFSLRDERVRELAAEVYQAGHGLAVHPGYRCSTDADALARALASFRQFLGGCGADNAAVVSRNHYLRWRAPESARLLERCGVREDRTLAYAQRAGFRAGTCKPFSVFDVALGRELQVIEQPLVVMESSLLDPRYEALDHEGARLRLRSLFGAVQRVRGTLSVLWHNSHLASEADCDLFEYVLGLNAEATA